MKSIFENIYTIAYANGQNKEELIDEIEWSIDAHNRVLDSIEYKIDALNKKKLEVNDDIECLNKQLIQIKEI